MTRPKQNFKIQIKEKFQKLLIAGNAKRTVWKFKKPVVNLVYRLVIEISGNN
jgi:hypothetical protein